MGVVYNFQMNLCTRQCDWMDSTSSQSTSLNFISIRTNEMYFHLENLDQVRVYEREVLTTGWEPGMENPPL